MSKRWFRKEASLMLALIAAAVLAAACSMNQQQPATSSERPVIKLIESPWSASTVNNAVAKVLLEEELGFPVEIVPLDEQAQWEALAAGEHHASLEVWPSGHVDNIQTYIKDRASVENGGLLGPVGRIAWFVPTYVIEAHPELASWEGFQDPENAALFKTEATGERGQFVAGDASWVQHDEAIIENLGLQLEVTYAGSEEAILAGLEAAYSRQQPYLFYFWLPHNIFAKYDLTAVTLPPNTVECYAKADAGGVDCGYPADPLFKIFWSGFQDYAPDAYKLLRQFVYTTQDQIEMLGMVELEGKSAEEAARVWLADNEEVWRAWLPTE